MQHCQGCISKGVAWVRKITKYEDIIEGHAKGELGQSTIGISFGSGVHRREQPRPQREWE